MTQTKRDIPRGARVRVHALGTITIGTHNGHFVKVQLDQEDGIDRSAWFLTKNVAEVNAGAKDDLFESEDWREVAADMIRAGRDKEAIKLLVNESPEMRHVKEYISALEDFHRCFNAYGPAGRVSNATTNSAMEAAWHIVKTMQ